MTAPVTRAPNAQIQFDREFGMQAAKILPGEYFVTDQNIVLITLLGSCVAACIRDTALGIGGMNHFLLPDVRSGLGDAEGSASSRYGAYAMEVLINQLIKMGAKRNRLEAKVFGGANVIPGLTHNRVGTRNAKFVIEFLRVEGIPLVAKDLEDVFPRKVAYFPATGEVRVKRLREAPPVSLLDLEQRYKKDLSSGPISGGVELFGKKP